MPLSIRKRYKILNDIAFRLGENNQAIGNIKLFIELDTCDSCSRVIADFS
ncbi:deaminase domain-containing protein [Peribacillus sp. NPDC097295]